MIKILHTSDWHIDQLNEWDKQNSFQKYHLSKIKEMIDIAIKEKVQLFVFAGDLYKNSSSNYKQKDYINKVLISYVNILRENNIEVLFISGNHDIRYKKENSEENNLSLFNTIGFKDFKVNSPISNKIEYKDYTFGKEKLRVILFPYLKGITKEQVKKDLKELSIFDGKVIIVGHLDVLGATYGKIEIQNLDLHNVNTWRPKELEETNVDLILLGHIHNKQILGKEKKVIYCGSPYKLSFAEEGIEKGYYIHSFDKNSVKSKFHSLNDKEWSTFKYDYKKNNNSFSKLLENIKEKELKGNIVRIIFEGITRDDYKYIPYKEIKDILNDKEIMLFRGFSYKEDRKKIEGKKEDNEDFGKTIDLEKLDPENILKRTLISDGMNEKELEESLDKLKELMDEIKK